VGNLGDTILGKKRRGERRNTTTINRREKGGLKMVEEA